MGFKVVLSVVLLISVLIDYGIIKRLKCNSNKRYLRIYGVLAGFFNLSLITAICLSLINIKGNGLFVFVWFSFAFVSFFFSKVIYVLFALLGLICSKLTRLKFLNNCFRYCGIISSVIVFCVLWWSALVTAKTPEVEIVEVYSERLPESFDGMRLVHISDFHLGSFEDNSEFPKKVVDAINELNVDLVAFTGDLVNSRATEAERFNAELSKVKATYGVYSVLGNHDYGDYYKWNSAEEKKENFCQLIDLQRECGWNVLNNDNVAIVNGNDTISILGVENWGDFPFPKYGKLQDSYPCLKDERFKILLSHNPVHWKAEVLKDSNIDVMLAGHTHAMQFVLRLADINWSPAKWRYKEWGGLYEENDRYLYVNKGLGFVGVPIRVGASPEITLMILKRK